MCDFWRFANERLSYEERAFIHRTTLATYASRRSVKMPLNELSYRVHRHPDEIRRIVDNSAIRF
jgi:hypothetical protein